MCCCGQGLESMIVNMNVPKKLWRSWVYPVVKVEHTAIGEVTEGSADLFVIRSRPCTSDDELQKQDHLKSAYGYEWNQKPSWRSIQSLKKRKRNIFFHPSFFFTNHDKKQRNKRENWSIANCTANMKACTIHCLSLHAIWKGNSIGNITTGRNCRYLLHNCEWICKCWNTEDTDIGRFSIHRLNWWKVFCMSKQLHVDPKTRRWRIMIWSFIKEGSGTCLVLCAGREGLFSTRNGWWHWMMVVQGTSHPDRTKNSGCWHDNRIWDKGTSAAAGIATGLRMKESSRYVYMIVGSGSWNERASARKPSNMLLIISWTTVSWLLTITSGNLTGIRRMSWIYKYSW